MNSFSLRMIPTIISVLVFLSSNIFIFQFDIAEVSAAPAINEVNIMKYLARYGYTHISEEEIENGARISKEDMTEAVKEYQEFYNITETGNLDEQTLNLMQQPRCGDPDKFPDHSRKKRYSHWGEIWKKKIITFKLINTLNNKKNQLPYTTVQQNLYEAMQLWQPHIPMKLEIRNYSDPDVWVSFKVRRDSNYPFDGPSGTLAHASLPWSGQSSYIEFDGEEHWLLKNSRKSRGTSFYQVAAHEMGHTLGLRHSTDRNAIMYPYHIATLDSKFRLGSDDIQGIETLYYKKKKRRNPFGKNQNW